MTDVDNTTTPVDTPAVEGTEAEVTETTVPATEEVTPTPDPVAEAPVEGGEAA